MEPLSGLSKNGIITELYQNSRINYLISIKAPEELKDDFKQDLFLLLFNIKEQKLIDLYKSGVLVWYVCRIILNACTKSTTIRRKYFDKINDDYFSKIISDNYKSVDEKIVKSIAQKIDEDTKNHIKNREYERHEALIMKMYIEFGSCESVALYFNVPEHHIKKIVKSLKTKIGKAIRNNH